MGSVIRVEQPRFDVRLSVKINVTLCQYGKPAQAMVMSDVSAAGALIVGDVSDLDKGDEVILTVSPEIVVVATVVWTRAAGCGLTFHRRLSNASLNAVLALCSREAGQGASAESPNDPPSTLPYPSRYSGLV